jgi:hypothetical protein
MGTTHHSRIVVCAVIVALAGPSALPGCEKSKKDQSQENGGVEPDIGKWVKELWDKVHGEGEPADGEAVEGAEETAPAKLSSEQIREVLEQRYRLSKDLTQADKYLSKARNWAGDTVILGNQYKALKCFKLYLAYQGVGHATFQEPADQRQYEELLRNLYARITELYKQGCVCEQSRDWLSARRYFWRVLKMIPTKEEPYPEPKNALFDNVVAHLEYSNRLLDGRKEP